MPDHASLSHRLRLAGLRSRGTFRAAQAEIDRRCSAAPQRAKIFRRQLGYDLDLRHPRTFNEKVQGRKLYDRRPDYPVVSDKLRLHDWAAVRLERDSSGLFVPLLAATNGPAEINFPALSPNLAIRTNHGSAWNILLRRGNRIDREEIVCTCDERLAQKFNRRKHEWAYWPIPPMIVVEELVLSGSGAVPNDLKLYMLDGVCRLVHCDVARFTEAHRRVYLTPDRADAGFTFGKLSKAEAPPRPQGWDGILGIAEKLSRDFDFVWVDFLLFDERHALNEMALCTGGGLKPFHPREVGLDLGAMWRLPDGRAGG